jgi:hypothetical protein
MTRKGAEREAIMGHAGSEECQFHVCILILIGYLKTYHIELEADRSVRRPTHARTGKDNSSQRFSASERRDSGASF